MVGGQRVPASLFIALGTAVAFYTIHYCKFPATLCVSILLCASIAYGILKLIKEFFALGLMDGTKQVPRRLLFLPYFYVSFVLGLSIGIGAAFTLTEGPALGMALERVRGIQGVLTQDPHKTASGRYMASIDLVGTLGWDTVFCSASGSASVFLEKEASSLPKGALVDFRIATYFGDPPIFKASEGQVIQDPGLLIQGRNRIRASIISRLDTQNWGHLAAALILGFRDDLDMDEAEAYRRAGCSHILALSGMHLGIISALIALILKRPLGLRGGALCGALIVLLYVFFVGPQPSLVRAALMYCIGAAAIFLGWPKPVSAILSLAFIFHLVADPSAGLSLSFMLSYLALGGILFAGTGFLYVLKPLLPSMISLPLSASMGAFLATASVSVAFFGILRPIGLLAGIPAALGATVLLVGGILWLLVDLVLPMAAIPLAIVLDKVAWLNGQLIQGTAQVPGLPLQNAGLVAVVTLAAYLLLVYGQYRGKRIRDHIDPFNQL